jgi:hypothetical protein
MDKFFIYLLIYFFISGPGRWHHTQETITTNEFLHSASSRWA